MIGKSRAPRRPAGGGIPLTDDQRLDWLRLTRAENVGPRTFRDLVTLHGGAAAALEALPRMARAAGKAALRVPTRAEAEAETRAAARIGGRFVALGEPDYPAALRMTASAPPVIAIRGEARALARPMVGIVGSRNASAVGLRMAERLARGLGERGYVTVSGLARGIDSAVHEASLATGTLAVLAGGLDRIYPPENAPLLERILATGVAITEMPMGHEPRAKDFPRRNRIIAGLGAGLVVVEAAERSGSLITARMALEENREIFAVPGSPLDPRAFGTNRLIKQGATLTTDVDDILDVLESMVERAPDPPEAEEEDERDRMGRSPAPTDADRARLVSLLGPVAVHIDEIVRLAAIPPGTARTILVELELAGAVVRDGADRVSLTPRD